MERYSSDDHDLIRWLNVERDIFGSVKGRFIAGGAVRSAICNQPITSDIDYFFTNEHNYNDFINIADKYENTVEKNESKYHNTYIIKVGEDKFKVQAIHISFFKDVVNCIDSFDFTICQTGLDMQGNMYVGKYTLWDLAHKQLVIHKVTYAVATFRRFFKYANKGYSHCPGTITTFLQEVADNPESIREDVQYVD